MEQPEAISSNDKVISLCCHLSMFFGSLIIPGIFWYMYRDKSKFIAFNSLQALFFHVAYTATVLFILFFFAIGGGAAGLFEEEVTGSNMGTPQIIFVALFVFVILALAFGSYVYAIYCAVKSYQGEIKMYPFIGSRVYKHVYGNNIAYN